MSKAEAIEAFLDKGIKQADKANILPALNDLKTAKSIVRRMDKNISVLFLNKVDKAEIKLMSDLCFQILENECQNISLNQRPASMYGRMTLYRKKHHSLPVCQFPLKIYWNIFGLKQSLKIETNDDGYFKLELPAPKTVGKITARVVLDTDQFLNDISVSALHNLTAREVNFKIYVS